MRLLLFLAALPALAQLPPIHYTLRFPAAHTHYVEVEAEFPAAGAATELFLPVWTPGSYLVREYARNVEGFAALDPDGKPLEWRKTRKNRWRVESGPRRRFLVRYRVYSRQMSVQSNWVERDFAILNGAATYIGIPEPGPRPHVVTVELPPYWKGMVSPLDSPRPGRLSAPDYDTLVDSPLLAGNPTLHEFSVEGRPHTLANLFEDGVWDGPRSARDAEAIVRETRNLWGSLPYPRYVFFNLITQAGGGLEHHNSTVLMTSRFATRSRAAYLRWLGLVAHELFHAWNVKRLRPEGLGPFDYENENYTPGLFIAEGFTTYYAPLTVHRARLSSSREYLASLSRTIEQLQSTPGRGVQPLAQSSFDAWIRHYRPDENSPNVAISYYTKGAVVAFLLDAMIRRATGNGRSLDHVMRLAYTRFAANGYTPAGFLATAEETAGAPLGDWWRKAVHTTEELDYGEALDWLGLQFRPAPAGAAPRPYLGAETRADAGRLLVARVLRNTPAYDAGLNVEDEILALDGFRVLPADFESRLGEYRPNDAVTLTLARRGRVLTLPVTLSAAPAARWTLELDPKAAPDRRRNREAWLGARGS